MGSTSRSDSKPSRPGDKAGNEGEGNRTADRHYREATTRFANSERGRREIEKAGDVKPGDEKEIRRAEEEAKRHAKERDV